MSFFAVLAALLLEQLKALPRDNHVHDAAADWIGWCERNFDAGAEGHAWIVWIVALVLPAALVTGVFLLLAWVHPLLGLALDVLVLYLCLGFRQFSHYFTGIRAALDGGNDARARELLARWQHLDTAELPRTELLRQVIEHALLAAHRHVFGVFFWFVLLSALGAGPAGAVLYRLAGFAPRRWAAAARVEGVPANERLLALARRLFALIDHLPARLTAAGFAVVGNFEESIAGWRRDAALWGRRNEGVILAAAAGAVGVQLGGRPVPGRSRAADEDNVAAEGHTPGVPPSLAHLGSVVGLVWRSVVLWMLLLALLTLANLLG